MKQQEKLEHHNYILDAIKRLADMPRIGLASASLTIEAIRGLTFTANAIYRIEDEEHPIGKVANNE